MTEELLRIAAQAAATNVDDSESNSVYMTVTLRMLSTAPNGNGHVIQKDFIQEIIDNQSWYVGTPIKADTSLLAQGITQHLGHKFNKLRREYMTEQIGSILSFEAAEENGETVLYGTARIEKTHEDICETIVDMYNDENLFFSFEIIAAKFKRENGLTYIGADPDNRLTAMCIVSVPAYEEARAIRLVANLQNEEFMENVSNLTKWAAELEVDDVRRKLFRLLFETDTPLLPGGWCWDIRELGTDYVLLKNGGTGVRMMINYHVQDNEVVVDEVYEVEIVRKQAAPAEPAAPADPEPVAAAAEPTSEPAGEPVAAAAEPSAVEPAAEPVAAAAAEPENIPAAAPAAESVAASTAEPVEPATPVDPAPAEPVSAELDVQKELEELRAFKASVEKARLDAELDTKRKNLKATMARLGLDVNAFSAEIQDLNYEKIFASTAEPSPEPEAPAEHVVNMMAGADVHLGNSKWDGLISDTTGLNN